MQKALKENYLLVFILIFLIQPCLYGQNNKVDSLKHLLMQRQKEDSMKVILLNNLSAELLRIEPDTALSYAQKARTLAQRIEFDKGRAESLRQIGKYYFYKGDIEAFRNYAESALDFSLKVKDHKGISTSYFYLGVIHYFQGNYTQSLINYEHSMLIDQETGNKKGVAKCLSNIGSIFEKQANYLKALDYCQQSLLINEELKDIQEMSKGYNNLGIIYTNTGDHTKAMDSYKRSLQFKEATKDQKGVSNTLANIGNIYQKMDSLEKSQHYYERALKIKREIGDQFGISHCIINIGNNLKKQGKYVKATYVYQEALKRGKKNKDELVCLKAYVGMSSILLDQQAYDRALIYTQKSLVIAKKLNLLADKKDIYKQLAEIYSALNLYEKAYTNHVLFKKMNDSLFNEDKVKSIAKLEFDYEYQKEKKVAAIEQQRKESLMAKEAFFQRQIRNMLGAGLIVLLILTIIILINLAQKRKTNKKLQAQAHMLETKSIELFNTNRKIQEQTDKVTVKNKELHNLSEFKEDLTNMIVHDLKGPLSAILNIRQLKDEEGYLKMVERSGYNMLNLVENILDVYKYKSTSIRLKKENIDLSHLANDAYKEVTFYSGDRPIRFVNDLNKPLVCCIDPIVIKRVIVNLLSNAIKFSPADGNIRLYNTLDKEGMVKISLTNQGPPLVSTAQKMIFDRFNQGEVRQFGKVRSTGLGLTFCKLAVEAHAGQIGVTSEPDTDVEFWFTLPMEIIDKTPLEHEIAIDKHGIRPELQIKLLKVLNDLQSLEVYQITEIISKGSELNQLNANYKEVCDEMIRKAYGGDNKTYKAYINKLIQVVNDY